MSVVFVSGGTENDDDRAARELRPMQDKLNIGPGQRWKKPGWTTLDHYVTDADIVCDLRDAPRLPLRSHALKKIFCSHVIEHMSDSAAESLFRECHRILAYGGVARFVCPDLDRAIAQYHEGLCDKDDEVVTKAAVSAPSHLRLLNVVASFKAPEYQGLRNAEEGSLYSGGPIAPQKVVEEHLARDTREQFVKWCVSLIPGDATYVAHVNAYWPAKLERMLREAGFDAVRVCGYRSSTDEELRGPKFDNRPGISLFVEGRALGLRKRLFAKYSRAKDRARAFAEGHIPARR